MLRLPLTSTLMRLALRPRKTIKGTRTQTSLLDPQGEQEATKAQANMGQHTVGEISGPSIEKGLWRMPFSLMSGGKLEKGMFLRVEFCMQPERF